MEQVCRIELFFRLAQSRIELLSVGGANACVTLILGHEVGVANACRKRVSCTPEFARPSDVLLVFVRCLPSGRNVQNVLRRPETDRIKGRSKAGRSATEMHHENSGMRRGDELGV